jgi:regulatory protein
MDEATFQITQIEPQKGHPNRVSIYLDGSFAFGLDREVVIKNHLHEGDKVTEDKIQNVLLGEEKRRAKEKALALLSYRARSIKELRDRLLKKGFSETTVSSVINDFIRAGLLDDNQFAMLFARNRMVHKPVSKRLLQFELQRKGIKEETAYSAVEGAYEDQTEILVARELVVKKTQGHQPVNPKLKKKVSDFLVRRGFGWDVISEVISEIDEE